MTSQIATRITEIGTVGVPVGDQDRALAFYTDQLGLELRLDLPFGEQRWIEVAPSGATTSLALVAATSEVPAGVETGVRLTTTDADADHAALRAAGVNTDPDVTRMGPYVPPMFSLSDPDGNRLVVVERPS